VKICPLEFVRAQKGKRIGRGRILPGTTHTELWKGCEKRPRTDLEGGAHVELLGVVAQNGPRRVQFDETQHLPTAHVHHLLQHTNQHYNSSRNLSSLKTKQKILIYL